MDLNCQLLGFRMVLFMGLVGLAVSNFISDDVFQKHGSGRTLEEAGAPFPYKCPINFKSQNYTVLSNCKAPEYEAAVCCSSFKEFACPFAKEINDVDNNDCATLMFDYIRLYGNFPVGMFYDKCKEGKLGLECPKNGTTSQ